MPGTVNYWRVLSPKNNPSAEELQCSRKRHRRGIMCRICPNECVLKEGETSKCNNRRVKDSKLYTMAFGNPCSANIDPVEKKPVISLFSGIKSIFHCYCRMQSGMS